MADTDKELILHIGLHKTATTSFQAVMHDHRQDFLKVGIDPFQTPKGIAAGLAKHGDIAFSVIRKGVLDLEPNDTLYGDDQSKRYKDISAELTAYIDNSEKSRFLISTEALSYLRTDEEIDRLKSIFCGRIKRFHILLVLRDREEWLASYRNQIIKGNIKPSSNPSSAFYLNGDNWLTDFESLIDVYRRGFGKVDILKYNNLDMVESLLRQIDVTIDSNTKAYRKNQRTVIPQLMRVPRLIFRKAFGNENQGLRRRWRHAKESWKK